MADDANDMTVCLISEVKMENIRDRLAIIDMEMMPKRSWSHRFGAIAADISLLRASRSWASGYPLFLVVAANRWRFIGLPISSASSSST